MVSLRKQLITFGNPSRSLTTSPNPTPKRYVSLNTKILSLEKEGEIASSDLAESNKQMNILEDEQQLAIEVYL